MRKSITLFFVLFTFSFAGLSVAQDNALETEISGNVIFNLTNPAGWVYESPQAVLFDNGPYFNSPGGGPGGSDGSVLQTSLLMSTLGAGHQLLNLIRVADDFTIPTGETWNISTVAFYAYQTGSPTTSTINHVNVVIWDGPPGAVGSNVIFGDTTTNVMIGTEFTNAYRYSETTVGTTRPIMKQTCVIGTVLTAGTYWIDWQAGGTLASGPWAPPVAILGQATTGNAMQKTIGTTGNVWANLMDTGSSTPQGLPFILEGTSGNPPVFFDNFDSYTAGNLVACSNPTAWTTWSNAPCGAEDAEVSSTYAFSAPNTAKIVTNDDLIKKFGATAFTTGKYKMSFRVYIPTGKAGYFNTLATFAGANSSWGMEIFFNTTGVCSLMAGSTTAITSANWPAATWFPVEHVVDLDANLSEMYINGVLVHTWQWTLGATGSGCPQTLDANDFFGATANDEMYMDDYTLELLSVVPVELTSFIANVSNGNVVLNWTTATELNNQGFEVERKIANGQFITIGHVQGNGTTTEIKEYSFTDANAQIGSYTYRLKQVDFNGTFEYSNEIFVDVTAPLEFALDQNYPNPFNPTTTINFSIAEPSFVKLAVYNLLGEEVKVLKNEDMSAGTFNISFDAASLPSGMYLYKIETAQYTSVRKMMLLK